MSIKEQDFFVKVKSTSLPCLLLDEELNLQKSISISE